MKKFRQYPHILIVDTCALMHDKIQLPVECKVHVPQVVYTELMFLSGQWQSRRATASAWGKGTQQKALDALLGLLLNVRSSRRGEKHWWTLIGTNNYPQQANNLRGKIRRSLWKKLSSEDRIILAHASVAHRRARGAHVTLITRDRALRAAANALKIKSVRGFAELMEYINKAVA